MLSNHEDVFDVSAELHRRAAVKAEPLNIDRDLAAFDELSTRLSGLLEKREGIELAIALQSNRKNAFAAPSFYAKADPYKQLAASRRRREQVLEETVEEIETILPQLDIARERLRLAQEERALAIAATFKTRQRRAVRDIAKALEALSKAVLAEQALHTEYEAQAPGFLFLPDFSGAWRVARLDDPRSVGSGWLRQAKASGYLDD